MSSTAKASIVIGGNTKELEAAVDRAMGKLQGMAATVAGLFVGGAAFSWGYDLLKQSEAAEIGFTQMLGSADLAQQTLKELADYAAKTPFDNPTLVKAYRNLLNFKFAADDIPGILRVLGDTAAAMPEGMEQGMQRLTVIMGQMKSKAKLSSQEMMQLTEAGINAWSYLAKELKVSSVAEAVAKVESGAVDSATGVRAVLKGMEADFGGVGQKMSGTVQGLMSTIGDNAGRALQAVFKGATGGEFKTWLADFGEGLNGLASIGESVGQAIGTAFQLVKNVFDGVWAVASAIGDVFTAVFGEWVFDGLLSGLGNLRTDFALVKSVAMSFIETVAIGFAYVADAISKYLVDPIQYFLGSLTKIVSFIIDGVGQILEIAGYVSDTAAEWAKNVKAVAENVNNVGDRMKSDAANHFNNGGGEARKMIDDFFRGIEKKQQSAASATSTSSAFSQADFAFWDDMDKAAASLLNFGKKVEDMSSIASQFGSEMSQLAKQAEDQRRSDAQKVMKDAKSPAQVFRETLSDLERMFSEGLINRDMFANAAAKATRDLSGSMPGYNPNGAIMAGSAEAQSAIIANRTGASRVEDILKSVENEAKQTKKINQDILKQLQSSKLVTLGV